MSRLGNVLEFSRLKSVELDAQDADGISTGGHAAMITHKFGVSADEYNDMLASQGGGCAICGLKCRSGKRLAIDHDHKTGMVRGLLCMCCNTAIGHLNDDKALLQRAIDYLS